MKTKDIYLTGKILPPPTFLTGNILTILIGSNIICTSQNIFDKVKIDPCRISYIVNRDDDTMDRYLAIEDNSFNTPAEENIVYLKGKLAITPAVLDEYLVKICGNTFWIAKEELNKYRIESWRVVEIVDTGIDILDSRLEERL